MSSYTNGKEYKFDVLFQGAQTKHHGPLINA